MRKKVIATIISFVLALTTGVVLKARGVEWQFFNTDRDGNPLYYDLESVENLSYETVNVWVKYRSVDRYKQGDYGHSVSLFKIDCFEKKIISEVIIDFDRQGSLLSSVTSPGEPWFSITQESLYTGLHKTVCIFDVP